MTAGQPQPLQTYQELVNRLYQQSNYDFVGVALQAPVSPHLTRWLFVAGNQNERFRRIVLRRGIGIAGLVLRTGAPFWHNDILALDLSDRLYSPIARAENLQAVVAARLMTGRCTRLVGSYSRGTIAATTGFVRPMPTSCLNPWPNPRMEATFLLETANWIQTFFDLSSDATFIFQADQLVVANQAGQDLIDAFDLDLDYLQELAHTAIAQQQSKADGCYDCEIMNQLPELTVPVDLPPDHTNPLRYTMVYRVLSPTDQVYALELKSRATLDRATQVAQQRMLNQYVNRAYEDERKRISQDLHDSIAQGVYSAIMGVRRLKSEQLDEPERQQVSTMIETQLDDTLREVKEMALDIRPSVLDSFGLVAAIRALAKRLTENSGVIIDVIGKADTSGLTTDVQSVLYRITQEAINNALKHANPTEITVMLVAHAHYISLEVIDNGCGFDFQAHRGFNGHSLGLMNMSERVKALNGSFMIDSAPGQGTTVTVKFPVIEINHQVNGES